MSEVLIHYDYNGGYFCREHYSPLSPFGIGRSVEDSVKDWIKKSFGWKFEEARQIGLLGYRFLLMDELSKNNFGGEITREKVREWEAWANSLSAEDFQKTDKCPHCGNFPFTPFTPSHYE